MSKQHGKSSPESEVIGLADNDGGKSNSASTALVVVVVVLATLCLALAAGRALAYLDKRGSDKPNHRNPLFAVSQGDAAASEKDDDIPDGALRAVEDADTIAKTAPKHKAEFEKAVLTDDEKDALELKRRDAMAAKRLELIKQIENAKTPEERARIKKLLETQ